MLFCRYDKGTTVKCIRQRSSILLYAVGYLWGIRGVFVGYTYVSGMYRVCVGYVSGMCRNIQDTVQSSDNGNHVYC